MRRKGILKSLFVFFLGAFITVSTPSIVASWKTGGNKEPVGASSSVTATEQNPVAYIAGSTKTYFASISKALTAASSGDIVIAIPATNKNYHSTSNAVANSSIDKKEYTITEDCEIKSGVTFVIPTDTDTVNSVTSSSTLNTYINSMKEDDHSRGTGYGSFASNSEGRWLRVTVNIAAGVTLTNNGTLVVSGYQNSGTSGGGLVGGTSHSYSRILLDSNAKIVQSNSSAKTYCFGYISEKTANNNSQAIFNTGTLYIPFILDDYRGFSYTWSMTYSSNQAMSTYKCSPFNQFEFRNIDCLTTIKYGCSVYGEITIYLSYPSQSIDKSFPKELSVVGSSNSFLVQLTDSTYSSLTYKFNKSTLAAKIIFYGGMTLNTLTLSISESIVTVNLSTSSSYFPVSYRQNVELRKANGQSGTASFSFNNQMIKMLPGSELIIGNGATFSGKNMIVYSTFYDGSLANGYSSTCAYNSFKYPLKTGGVVKVESGGKLTCTAAIAGTFYGAASDISAPSTTSITANEAWSVGSSGSINPAWKITDYLQISETYQRMAMSDFSKKKIYVGVNTFMNYNSYKPSLQVISDEGLSTQVTSNANQVQKVIHLDDCSTYRLEFLNNVYKAFKYQTAYVKDEAISYNASNPICGVINSTMSISSNASGVNEFDVQSVTVTCATPMVDGHYPLYPESSIQLVADVVDINKSYTKTITWSSSNTSIATVDSTGKVTGVALGDVTINATCDGVSGSINLSVIEEEAIVPIDHITITDNKGNSSEVVAGNSSDAGGDYNGAYSNNTNVTFTVNIFPSNAPYASIKWTFRASAAGRQYMNDNTQTTETATNVTSVVIHIVSGSGASPDGCSLTCEVTDLQGVKFTKKFQICHNADTTCITADDLVLLADGTYARADTLHIGDLLKTWSFEKGDWVIEPIIFMEERKNIVTNVITIGLEDGTSLEMSWKQGFFDADLLDYFVVTDDNFDDIIGRNVLAFDGDTPVKKKIVSATSESKLTSTYEIHTGHGYQFVANGILTVEPLINEHVWFTVNEDYKYDEELMRQDLETYGVLPYEVFAEYVTEEQYDLFNGQYLSVPIGKGYFTLEELMEIIKHFLPGNT